ncbi:hypothetical protein KGO5_02409 [Sinorhizobium sp. KGO-5]|uniref:DUF1810 family protein n=1 Tax=Sinorhizobium sp. KGO-5 TaxID=1470810 RepID=UPI002948EAEF|nr:hypothetical protein KGO5_02409 [Sinorhizobium sp. KGO-5]
MWFIFAQLRALGRSHTANFYGIGSIEEARAYLRHPVLADRLALAVNAVLGVSDRSAHEIFGSPDELKFRSSMTLFKLQRRTGNDSGSLLSVSLPANQIIVPSNSLAAATTRRVPQRSLKSRERLPLSTFRPCNPDR